jgi:hypothetical protein
LYSILKRRTTARFSWFGCALLSDFFVGGEGLLFHFFSLKIFLFYYARHTTDGQI